jgi:CCR4-NOT transcriptional complex subunit CAF120
MELERPDGAGGGYRRKDDLPDLPASSAPPVPAVPVAGAAILPVAGAAPRTEVRSVTPQQLRQAEQQHEQELREHNVHAPTPRKVSSKEVVLPSTAEAGLESEPAAVYLMNMVDEPQHHVEPTSVPATSTREGLQPSPAAGRIRSPSDGTGGNLTSIGRKPSGARAPPPKKQSTGPSRALSAVDETGQPIASPAVSTVGLSQSQLQPQDQGQHAKIPSSTSHHDLGEDVSAFVAYADAPSPDKGKSKALAPPAKEETVEGPRSSFALSKSAADRRARAEAAAAEQERAKYIPGAGKRTAPRAEQWHGNESESEDESEEDEVDDSPEVRPRAALPEPPLAASQRGREGDATVERSTSQARALPSIPRPGANGAERDYSMPSELDPPTRYRPASRSPGPRQEQYRDQGRERDQYADNRQSMAPPRSQYDTQRQSQINPPASLQQQQNPNRQTVWNANFAADHGMQENKSGKFVEMDDPATHLTKAFAPHGLLQAGLQDKEDRSAKRQEELARETGTSLISVPSKPPPPQTGLLGAVAAHERERKNAGGIGATLTDREREKRLNVSPCVVKSGLSVADCVGGPTARDG